MAHCVISAVMDSDDGQVAPACVVHAADDCRDGGREAVVAFWEARTHRQRLLVLHHGSLGDERDHAVGNDDRTCWCHPDVFPAECAA